MLISPCLCINWEVTQMSHDVILCFLLAARPPFQPSVSQCVCRSVFPSVSFSSEFANTHTHQICVVWIVYCNDDVVIAMMQVCTCWLRSFLFCCFFNHKVNIISLFNRCNGNASVYFPYVSEQVPFLDLLFSVLFVVILLLLLQNLLK